MAYQFCFRALPNADKMLQMWLQQAPPKSWYLPDERSRGLDSLGSYFHSSPYGIPPGEHAIRAVSAVAAERGGFAARAGYRPASARRMCGGLAGRAVQTDGQPRQPLLQGANGAAAKKIDDSSGGQDDKHIIGRFHWLRRENAPQWEMIRTNRLQPFETRHPDHLGTSINRLI